MLRASLALVAGSLLIGGCGDAGKVQTSSPARPSPAVPTPTAIPPHPTSWMKNSIILTLYGRAFANAPILGRLGMDTKMADVAAQAAPLVRGIGAEKTGKKVRIAIHLIYAMATGCSPGSKCLNYLDETGVDIVKQYIRPAAKRGWLVILDDQMGRATARQEVNRVIAKGYLRFDNVAFALDPEFRTGPSQDRPGIPVGSVTAAELNGAEATLRAYAVRHPSRHHRLLLLHQFQTGMIEGRASLKMRVRGIDTVIVMDGFGDPGVKAHVYHDILSHRNAPGLRWRGIKLFYPNPYEQAGHADGPLMTWGQVLGREPALDINGLRYWVSPPPNVVVVA